MDKTSDSEDLVQKLAQTSNPQQRGSRRRENGSRRISGFLSITTNPVENSPTMVQTNAKKMRDPATKIVDLSTSEGNLGETVSNLPNTGLEESIKMKIDQQQNRKNGKNLLSVFHKIFKRIHHDKNYKKYLCKKQKRLSFFT